MTESEMRHLDSGDIVRHKGAGDALVVITNDGTRVTAVRLTTIMNPGEWILVSKNALNKGSHVSDYMTGKGEGI